MPVKDRQYGLAQPLRLGLDADGRIIDVEGDLSILRRPEPGDSITDIFPEPGALSRLRNLLDATDARALEAAVLTTSPEGGDGVDLLAIAARRADGALELTLLEAGELVPGGEDDVHRASPLFERILDAIQDGISVLDNDLNIVSVNHWMNRMYGSGQPIEGRKCYEVYQRRSSPCPWCPSLDALREGTVHTSVVPYPEEGRPEGWIELSAYPLDDEHGNRVGVIEYVKDISPQKMAEARLRERIQELETLRAVGRRSGSPMSPDLLAETMLSGIAGSTGSDCAMILVMSEGRVLLNRSWPHAGSVCRLSGDGFREPGPDCLCISVARDGEPVYRADLAALDVPGPADCLDPAVRSVAVLPLTSEDGPLGAIALGSSEPRDYSTSSAFLETLAMEVALSIGNSILYQRLEEKAYELEGRVRQRTTELEQSREKLRAQYQAIPVPTYTWQWNGSDFLLIDYNDAAMSFTNAGVADLVGSLASRLFESEPLIPADMRRCLEQHTTIEREMDYRMITTGSSRRLSMKIAFVPPDLVMVHAEDITELHTALHELRQRRAELEEANRELEAFSYSVSHDLKAPLRAITGFSSILEEDFSDALPGEVLDHIETIKRNAAGMTRLIDDLLSLARLGRRTLEKSLISLETLVDKVIEEHSEEIRSQGVKIIRGELEDCRADPSQVGQVFSNLISNALKFTRGTQDPVIEIGMTDLEGRRVIHVSDNGVGFDQESSGQAFEVFSRLHDPAEYEGTGVGLAIVDQVVRRHGGFIEARSSKGEGATFYFTLWPGDEEESA